jgi:hypothetical protein
MFFGYFTRQYEMFLAILQGNMGWNFTIYKHWYFHPGPETEKSTSRRQARRDGNSVYT